MLHSAELVWVSHCSCATVPHPASHKVRMFSMSHWKWQRRESQNGLTHNMMNVPITDLRDLSKKMFDDRVDKIKNKIDGRLIIKEYPTASVHVGHFRTLLEELKVKQNFVPDIIYVDYLNICVSQRLRGNVGANSYTIVKSIMKNCVDLQLSLMSRL